MNNFKIKSTLLYPFAKWIHSKVQFDKKNAVLHQNKLFKYLIHSAKNTQFGRDNDFSSINSSAEFKKRVKIQDYESLREYIERIKKGTNDVLWPGLPKYFAKTSGTTSGIKYIPVTKESIPNHISTARNALINYAFNNKLLSVFDGKMMFLSGSPELSTLQNIKIGRLSGIVHHEVPAWVRGNQVPPYNLNCISNWEEKIDQLVKYTSNLDMRLISGIPPWIQMYYERILEKSKKETIKEVFPNYKIFAFGGVNYKPYEQVLENLVGQKLPMFETFPASEGFIAFQDNDYDGGLLLNTNAGIYFEFIPLANFYDKAPPRLSLIDVELDVDYAIILSTNAGLWAYNLGDTVRFVSKDPFRVKASGRIKHFISAFGEHVIAYEVEQCMSEAIKKFGLKINEFTVAPNVNPEKGLPYHEWLIEFNQDYNNLSRVEAFINKAMCDMNIYYYDLINDKILQPCKIKCIQKLGFQKYMASIGKLGGQNKVPRLSNDRKIANKLLDYKME